MPLGLNEGSGIKFQTMSIQASSITRWLNEIWLHVLDFDGIKPIVASLIPYSTHRRNILSRWQKNINGMT